MTRRVLFRSLIRKVFIAAAIAAGCVSLWLQGAPAAQEIHKSTKTAPLHSIDDVSTLPPPLPPAPGEETTVKPFRSLDPARLPPQQETASPPVVTEDEGK